MTQSGAFGPQLTSIMINMISDRDLRSIATCFNHPTEGWLATDQIGFTDLGTFPRKLSGCQYVVGSESMVCMRRSDPAQAAKFDVLGQIGDALPTLMEADPTVGATMAEGGAFAKLMDPAFVSYRPHVGSFMASLQQEGLLWNGAPVRFRGQVIATFCLSYLDLPNGELSDALVQAQLKAVRKLEEVLERIADREAEAREAASPKSSPEPPQGAPPPGAPQLAPRASSAPPAPSEAPSVGATSPRLGRTSASDAKDRVSMLKQLSRDGSLSSMVGLPASPKGAKPPPSPPSRPPSLEADGMAVNSLHQLSGQTLSGGTLEMSSLAGKAVIVTNTASK